MAQPRPRLARSALSERIEEPFPSVSPSTRRRIEERTGRTLEESYEGFTRLVASAVDLRRDVDRSSAARQRDTGQRRGRE